MRQTTSLLILAALFGAATGATAAWQISRNHRTAGVAADRPGTRAQLPPRYPARASAEPIVPTLEHKPEIPAPEPDQHANPAGSTRLSHEAARSSESRSVASAQSLGPENARPADDAVLRLAYSLVAWTEVTDVHAAEQGCLSGEPTDCLRLADLADQSGGSSAQIKSRGYRERAYSMLVLQCKRRDPDACVIIARMHARGFDVLRAPNSQQALVAHARELCKRRTAKVCSAFTP